MMRAMIGTARVFVLLAVVLAAIGCGSSTKSGRLRKQADALDYPERELRLALMDYTRLFTRALARMSEEILRTSDDPVLRARTLHMRIGATSLCLATAFQPEPLAGLVDTWTLTVQLRQYIETEEGKQQFEDHQPLALETLRRLEAELDSFSRFLPEPVKGRTRIQEWAAQHPVAREFGYRPSPAADLASISGDANVSAFEAVESLNVQVADLGDRLSTLSVMMPEQIRAEALLITERTMARDDILATRRDIRVMADSLGRLADLDQRILEIVETERDAIIEKVRPEVRAVTEDVDRQRKETLVAVTAEREAMLAEIDRQRVDTLAELTAQREAILAATDEKAERLVRSVRGEWTAAAETLRLERTLAMEDLAVMTGETMAATQRRGEELIDRLAVRLAQAGGALILLGLVAAILFRRFGPRSAPA